MSTLNTSLTLLEADYLNEVYATWLSIIHKTMDSNQEMYFPLKFFESYSIEKHPYIANLTPEETKKIRSLDFLVDKIRYLLNKEPINIQRLKAFTLAMVKICTDKEECSRWETSLNTHIKDFNLGQI